MPSLRRRAARVANEPLPTQEEHSMPSPSRARSLTTTGVTPRKSFQSLVNSGSVRKRGATIEVAGAGGKADFRSGVGEDAVPSPKDSIVDQTLNSSHSRSSLAEAACQPPSPHSTKVSAVSSLSKLPKLKSSKSFLETLADVIRAPAALFYKEKKKSKDGGHLVGNQVDPSQYNIQADAGNGSRPASPTKSLNSKKSVRFKPGKSIIKDEPRSSPIDIPKPAPSLPPVQLATTPMLLLLGEDTGMPDMIPTGWASQDMPHMIPTGRPRSPPVLRSSITYRLAKAEAQEYAEDKVRSINAPESPAPEAIKSSIARVAPIDNPFEDPKCEPESAFSKRTLPSSGDVDDQPAANDQENVGLLDTASNSIRLVTASVSLLPEHDKRTPSLCASAQSIEDCLSVLLAEIRTKPSRPASGSPYGLLSVDQYDADTEELGQGSTRLRHSTPGDRQVSKKWMRTPTLEDIRGRFKYPEDYVARLEELDPFSDHGSQDSMCVEATITPLPNTSAEINPVHLPDSALERPPGLSPSKKRQLLRSSSDGNPVSPSAFLRNPPWSSELVFRWGKSTSEERQTTISPRSVPGRLSSFEAKGHLDDMNDQVVEHTQDNQDSTFDLLVGVQPAPQPFPGRIVSSETHTRLSAEIPLPLSSDFPTTRDLELQSENYGIYLLTDECSSDEACLPPGNNCRVSSSEFWPQESVFSPFNDEAEIPPKSFEDTSGNHPGCESQENVVTDKVPETTPHVTAGEQPATAVEVSKQVTPRKISAADPGTPRAATPVYRAQLIWSAKSHKVSSKSEPNVAETPTRNRATTMASSKCPTTYSRKSRNTASTDTTEAMEADEAMCKGLV